MTMKLQNITSEVILKTKQIAIPADNCARLNAIKLTNDNLINLSIDTPVNNGQKCLSHDKLG